MSWAGNLVYKIKRSDHPFFKRLKKLLATLIYPPLLRLPSLFKPALRALYEFHWLVIMACRTFLNLVYWGPLFQARCASLGKNVHIESLPFVVGPVEIHLGDYSKLGGNCSILSGSICENPRLIFKERSGIGWGTYITVNREVILEENVIVSYNCRISDTDGHRREADLRAAGLPPLPEDCRPVRICKDAWIGNGSYILKGVTIGEGAIVAANSVVISNIPPYSLAMGNPAEVILPNFGLPSTMRKRKQKNPPDTTA